jgi:isopentenyl phosphate kinase
MNNNYSKLIYIKLGGSLVTDKNTESTAHPAAIKHLAAEIYNFKFANPATQIIVGHGAGSFGHIQAVRNKLHLCAHSSERWAGVLEVAQAVSQLSRIIQQALHLAGLQTKSFHPSESAVCRDKQLISLDTTKIKHALDSQVIPLIHGDICFDETCGASIISTESIFAYISTKLQPTNIYIAGTEPGVYDSYPEGNIIPAISTSSKKTYFSNITTSKSPDITGGMKSKVNIMLELIRYYPDITVRIFSGTKPGNLTTALTGQYAMGTILSANHPHS